MAIKTWTYPATTLSTGPIQFSLDGVDTVVFKDTSVPANSVALPVEIMGTAGPINITAGDLNVQLSDLGSNFDRTRIGDGINQLDITISNEAKVSDATSHTSLASLDTKTPALVSGRVPVDGSGVTQPVSIAATVTVSGPLTDAQLRATPLPVSGSVTADNASIGEVNVTLPAFATLIGGTDGTSTRVIATSASGVVLVDGSNSTQPVSIADPVAVTGPLTDSELRASAVPVSLSSTTITGSVAVTGPLTDTQLRASSVPVSGPLTDTQLRASVVPVSLSSTTITGSVAVTGPLTDVELRATAVPVSGTVTANIGTSGSLALDATLTGGTQQSKITDGTNVAAVKAASTAAVAADKALVVALSPNNPVTISAVSATTATASNVSAATSSTSILASNASRKMALFFNDSTASLYLKFGTTASTTSFTVLIPPQGYYEMPVNIYSGAIDGIWSAANGAVRVTEY